MLDVLGADGDEAGRIHNVIVAVGQREAALEELGDLLRRILVVLADVEVEKAVGSAVVLKLAEQGRELFGAGKAVDGRKGRLDRREGLLFHHVRVHAGGIEVAVLFLQRSFWVFGGGVQILPEQVAMPLPEQQKRPRPAHLVGRNGIVLNPVAAGVLVEVRAGVGGFVDGRQVEALDDRRGGGAGCVGWRGRGRLREGGTRGQQRGSQQQDGSETKTIHRMSSWKQGQSARSIGGESAQGMEAWIESRSSLEQPLRCGLRCRTAYHGGGAGGWLQICLRKRKLREGLHGFVVVFTFLPCPCHTE